MIAIEKTFTGNASTSLFPDLEPRVIISGMLAPAILTTGPHRACAAVIASIGRLDTKIAKGATIELKKGDSALVPRDGAGIPVWSGWRR